MNVETAIRELESANPATKATNKSLDAAWSEFRSAVETPRRSHRRIVGLAGLVAAAVVIALILSGAWAPGTSTNAAAAQLTKIADAARSQKSKPTLLPHQFGYLETRDSASDVSRKVHGKWIYATQSVTQQNWIGVLKDGRTGECRFKQTVGPVTFLRGSKLIWKNLGKPSIGAKDNDVTQRGCGQYSLFGPGVAPPVHVTPATLLATIRRRGDSSDGQVFLGLTSIYFFATPPSPVMRSAILTDMAKLKGVVALGAQKDSLGRRGLGFSYALTRPPGCLGNCGRVHYVESIILNPITGSLLSMTTDQQGPTNTTTILDDEVVDSIHSVTSSSN
jgi:hypothetical protein